MSDEAASSDKRARVEEAEQAPAEARVEAQVESVPTPAAAVPAPEEAGDTQPQEEEAMLILSDSDDDDEATREVRKAGRFPLRTRQPRKEGAAPLPAAEVFLSPPLEEVAAHPRYSLAAFDEAVRAICTLRRYTAAELQGIAALMVDAAAGAHLVSPGLASLSRDAPLNGVPPSLLHSVGLLPPPAGAEDDAENALEPLSGVAHLFAGAAELAGCAATKAGAPLKPLDVMTDASAEYLLYAFNAMPRAWFTADDKGAPKTFRVARFLGRAAHALQGLPDLPDLPGLPQPAAQKQ